MKSGLSPLVIPYYHIRDELAVTDGLVFRGERLVIPKGMRSQIQNDIHSGHQGIETCLRRARKHVFWPGMNKEVKEWIQSCETCGEFEQTHSKESLMSHELPERAWEKIGTDLLLFFFTMERSDLLLWATNSTSGSWNGSPIPSQK